MAESAFSSLKLSPEELAVYKRKFDIFDVHKTGVITLRTLAAAGKVAGYQMSRAELEEIFGKRDLNESGGITFDEFVIALKNRAVQNKEIASLKYAFKSYDTKSKGYIISDDTYEILNRELGYDESMSDAMVDFFDKDRDYRLSAKEFIPFQKKVEELKNTLQSLFKEYDKDADGFIDEIEARAMLSVRGFSEHHVQKLMDKYDLDKDGKLNFHEFAAFCNIPFQ